jgi:hypothetical protein
MQTSGKPCREKAMLCLVEAMFGNGNASATHSLSSSAKAGDPVRRGFTAQALPSLEY